MSCGVGGLSWRWWDGLNGLLCQVASAAPPVKNLFFIFEGNDKHQMLYDDMTGTVSLLIKAIGPGDEGEYTCTALNPYGEAICTVYISPEATKQVKKSR